MTANENFTVIIISLLCVAAYIQARTAPQLGDMRMKRTNGKWICDMTECPLNTFRCFVAKSNDEPPVLKTVNICYSRDNTTLVQKNYSSPTDPNYRIRQYINSYGDGRLISAKPEICTSDATQRNEGQRTSNSAIGGQRC